MQVGMGVLPLPAGEVTSHTSPLRLQERRLSAILRDRPSHMVLCAVPPLVSVGVHSYAPPDSSLGSVWGTELFILAHIDSYISPSSLGTWL